MKHIALKFQCLLVSIFIFSTINGQSIYLVSKSGTQSVYPLSNLKSITFSGSNINLNKKDGSTVTANLFDVRLLSFYSFTDVQNPKELDNSFKFSPNPVSDRLNISFRTNNNQSNGEINIFTIDGKMVYSNRLLYSTLELHINTTSWERGIYILNTLIGNEITTTKIIKN